MSRSVQQQLKNYLPSEFKIAFFENPTSERQQREFTSNSYMLIHKITNNLG